MTPPEDKLAALLQVIYWALIDTRATAWRSETDASAEGKAEALAKCASLTDAIHNIPLFLNDWERWNHDMFLTILRCHDEKWADSGSVRLEAVYENALQEYRART